MYLTQIPQVNKKPENRIQQNHDTVNTGFFCAIKKANIPKKEKNIRMVSNKMKRDCVKREFSVPKKKQTKF